MQHFAAGKSTGGETSVHGGVTFFRGTGASATAYLESDHHRADEYYLEEEGQLAERFVYGPEGSLEAIDSLDAEHYKSWVDWTDPETGAVRGKPKGQARMRQDDGVVRALPASPRFAEMTVNCDKSLSVAAALDPAVSAALDAAQHEAAQAMSEYVAANAVTRVGPLGGQRLVKAERFEAVAVVHKTSRAGDPHRHIHVQWNTRVFAEGKWRGLWTTPTLKQQGALRGIGESAIRSHEGLRTSLAEAGFTFDTATGKVVELSSHAELLSKRRAQVQENVAVIETAWRSEHPGQEPSAEQRRVFDFKAWALDRPGKKAKNREVSQAGWIEELRAADLPTSGFTGGGIQTLSLAELDQEQIASEAIAVCEGKASAWSLHQLQAAVADQVAAAGVIADRSELNAFINDTALLAAQGARSISDPRDGHMPDHVRHITSECVIAVEDELKARFTARVVASEAVQFDPRAFSDTNLGQAQKQAAQIVASRCGLGVIEGAAGSGKTTMLREAKTALDAEERQLVVLAPTLKGAQEAARSLDAPAFSVHKLLHANGFRWDENGRYTRLKPGESDPNTGKVYQGPRGEYRLTQGARVVVDEAGMLDQDTSLALVQLVDQYEAGLVLMGDRAQLPAVGRGGVLDHAAKIAIERADIDVVHRFADPKYAELSLRMRTRDKPADLFNALYTGGHIRIHTSTEEALSVMTEQAAQTILTGGTVALATPTNDMATQINAAMQQQMSAAGRTRDAKFEIAGVDGLTLRHGDTIMTRNNDTMLGVANREIYTVHTTHADGSISVSQGKGKDFIRLPQEYVTEYVHLGYASTEYGAQGATETTGAGLLDNSSTAGGTYVAATRGVEANTLHLVAASTEDAQAQFVDIMGRDTADRGIEAAMETLAREIDGLDLSSPLLPAGVPGILGQERSTATIPVIDSTIDSKVQGDESGPEMASAVTIIDAASLPEQLHLGQACSTDWINVTDAVPAYEFAIGIKPQGALWTGTRMDSTPSGAVTSWSETYYRRGYDQERKSTLSLWDRLGLVRKPEKLWEVHPTADARIVVLESVSDLAAAARRWPTAQGQVSFEAMAADGIDGIWVSKGAVTQSWSSQDREAPHAEVRAQFYGWEVESVAWLRTENITVGKSEPVNRDRTAGISRDSSTRAPERIILSEAGPASVDEHQIVTGSSNENRNTVEESTAAAPSAPVQDPEGSQVPDSLPADTELRERRVKSETSVYERKLAAWHSRRTAYETQHGFSPEEWQQLNTQAVDSHREAKSQRETIEHNVISRVEQGLRADHARLADEVTTARHDLDQAGLFSKNAARRALAEVEARYEVTFGSQPEATVLPEPPLHLVQKIRAQALTGEDQDLARARTIEQQASVKASTLKDTAPKWCTEQDRPKPPAAGTPEQENAKDSAFAGRVAQAKRTKASSQTSAPTPGHNRGPEH